MSTKAREPQKITKQLTKKLEPLVQERIQWNNLKKDAETELKRLNETIEILMVQNKIELTEMLGHRVGVYKGTNVTADKDIARDHLMDLTNDVDVTQAILDDIWVSKEYSYIKVEPIKAAKVKV